MEEVIGMWHTGGVIHDILQHKLVFIETVDTIETSLALENFKRACDCGRGAVLLSVARYAKSSSSQMACCDYPSTCYWLAGGLC